MKRYNKMTFKNKNNKIQILKGNKNYLIKR